MAAVAIRGTTYPVVLPKLKDPRLHLAATITSLQVIGQIGFHFRLSIAQILISLLTCAVIEVAIAAWRQHVILWPASALLTGNGVAFILRVPGTHHGDWWTLTGWWIYAATAAVSLLSKYVIKWRGEHIFNPSNIGLVLCFLILGRGRAEPLDFWWGPMSAWLVAALAVILTGGFLILSRLKLLWIAISFWVSFALGIGVLAATDHAMLARWHLGPISGVHFWWVLLTSPEVLVFLFFMITDPKTAPRAPRARIAYAVAIGLLGALLIAPMHTEYASKVGLLCSLAVVCAAMPLLRLVAWRPRRSQVALAGGFAFVAYAAALVALGLPTRLDAQARRVLPPGELPAIAIQPSVGVQSRLDLPTAKLIAHDLVTAVGAHEGDRMTVHLAPGGGQNPPIAVAQLAGVTYRLTQAGNGVWALATPAPAALPAVASGPALDGYSLKNVAPNVGLAFTQASFRYGVVNDPQAMMGGGLCWLDANGDGWLDLYAVNGYTDDNIPAFDAHGGLPTGALFINRHGEFVNLTKGSGLDVPLRAEGCVAGDFDGDGHTDLFVTTSTDDALFWGNGDGTFTEGARKAGVVSFGWHAGAAIADVNGDGRPDLYVAGYTDYAHPIPTSIKGFPSNYPGVRDELFLNEGDRHFREVGTKVGLDHAPFDHSLGAEFMDVNGDGRPDLYVANDEDPNRLYLNEPGGPLGFHFVDEAKTQGIADPNAGMGIAKAGGYLFVSNSRGQTHAVYRQNGSGYTDVRKTFAGAFGTNLTGWGDSWVDLRNDGHFELALANGAIPVTSLKKDAAPLQILARKNGKWVDAHLSTTRENGRGLAAADYDNDGRVDFAVNTIGGKLMLFHNTSPAGHWLEVNVAPFSPGAVVTVGRATRTVTAGSSYLSSEDPRVHFGLGSSSKPVTVTVRYPDGTTRTLTTPVDQIVTVRR